MSESDREGEQRYEDELRFRAKRELRKRMRSVRGALPASAIEQRSRSIIDRLVTLDEWGTAKTVALFMSLPDEVQLGELIRIAREEHKRVALPVVVDGQPTLTFRAPFDGAIDHALVTSPFGIQEPAEDAPVVAPNEIDLAIVPALAIDPRGHRIGYGAGYYDHTLTLMTRAVRVAVAFDFQLIAEVPIRAGDVPVTWIVTDSRVMRAES
jgi:5-formyltetrahydrofolate cyclo-ligase